MKSRIFYIAILIHLLFSSNSSAWEIVDEISLSDDGCYFGGKMVDNAFYLNGIKYSYQTEKIEASSELSELDKIFSSSDSASGNKYYLVPVRDNRNFGGSLTKIYYKEKDSLKYIKTINISNIDRGGITKRYHGKNVILLSHVDHEKNIRTISYFYISKNNEISLIHNEKLDTTVDNEIIGLSSSNIIINSKFGEKNSYIASEYGLEYLYKIKSKNRLFIAGENVFITYNNINPKISNYEFLVHNIKTGELIDKTTSLMLKIPMEKYLESVKHLGQDNFLFKVGQINGKRLDLFILYFDKEKSILVRRFDTRVAIKYPDNSKKYKYCFSWGDNHLAIKMYSISVEGNLSYNKLILLENKDYDSN
ncbi:hypothetical protein QRL16_000331 [Vibrio parahaemolyticus]|nr:hypothetical protein [Vibrio parahaemolyticus]